MHGGPLAAGTVDAVAEFAENIASEALAATIEGRLLSQTVMDYFLDRENRIDGIRNRLARGEAPADLLFAEPDA